MQGENIGALNVLTGPGVLFDLENKNNDSYSNEDNLHCGVIYVKKSVVLNSYPV